jgi:aspartate kinase
MIPAVHARIPIRVLNTYRPEQPGTVILDRAPKGGDPVKSIAHRSGLSLISVESSRMLMQPGFMARLFEVFGRHEVVIDMVATSEVTVSLTTDTAKDVGPAVEELREIAEVTVEKDKAIVCLVGEGIRDEPGVLATVFDTLRDAGVRARMVSFAASNVNVSLLVPARQVKKAVQSLHARFFEGSPAPRPRRRARA